MQLPRLIELADMRGDVHMHTTATDGHNSIREMAEAALWPADTATSPSPTTRKTWP